MRSEYLIFNVLIVRGSFLAVSLFRRYSRFPKFIPALCAILIPAFLFTLMNHLVTNVWWYFNSCFILGLRPVVTYNPLMKSNVPVLTVPLEDPVYGMVIISLVVVLYEFFAQFPTFQFYANST